MNDLPLDGPKRAGIVLLLAGGSLAALCLLMGLVTVTVGYTPMLALVPFAAVAVLIAALVWIPD